MATQGTPYEGRDNIIVPAVYTSGLKLGVYTNTAGSLSASTVLANITQPTGAGSGDKTLNGTWSSSNGVITYDDGTPDNPIFENTDSGNWSADVTGIFLHNGTYILHFKDLSSGAVTMTPGDQIEVDISTLIS